MKQYPFKAFCVDRRNYKMQTWLARMHSSWVTPYVVIPHTFKHNDLMRPITSKCCSHNALHI